MEELQRREKRARKPSSFASQLDMSVESEPMAPSRPASSSSTMNPSALAFTPGATTSPDNTSERLRSVNQSLCKALAEARQAHNATKIALEKEVAKRAKAEEEVKSLLKINSSLASTAQMLGAIVEHNISKPNKTNTPDEADSIPSPEEMARFQGKNNSNLLNTFDTMLVSKVGGNTIDTTPSILYDVLDLQKAQYQLSGYPTDSAEHLAKITPALSTNLGDRQHIEKSGIVESTPKVSQKVNLADGGATSGQNKSRPTREGDTLADTTAAFQSLPDFRDVMNNTICMPYQCRPKWAISQNRPLFDDDQEIAGAQRLHGSLQRHHALFWQHPVRYLPASDEKNLCRTLIIDFLPLNTTMKEALGLIRGGALESIQLFPPVGLITDFMTARVVFHYELPADDMYIYWQKYGLKVRDQPIRVLQLGYTYPKNRQLDEDVFIRCYTRILLIENINDRVIQCLPAYLNRQVSMGFVVEIGQADDGITMIEFTSIVEAAKAMRAMQTDEMFYGAIFDFEDDYCEEGSYAY